MIIPLYRLPIVPLLTISLPIWILGWVSLAIFFQDFGLGDRIASIATVMIAYTQFFVIIRQQLPKTHKITFMETLINTSIIINIFCLIESVLKRGSGDEFELTAFFMIAFIFQILFVLIVIGLMMIHQFVWKPSYNVHSGVDWLLEPFEWNNTECDKHFKAEIEEVNQYGIQIIDFNH